MRKMFAVLVVTAVLFGIAGTAFAENGTIWPFSTKSGSYKVKPMENSTIWPF
ncbi:MAG TPA: hypothetical protein VD969_00910 [Symbiobacteriaceae bacterium]|nr:hypothetical protein [Symbiobacteriaceae bacterium]